MSKKLIFLISFVLVASLASTNYGSELVGDFEQTLDGWEPQDSPPITLEMMTSSTNGATLRDYSLRLDAPGAFIWAIRRPLHTEAWKVTNNNYVAFDVTWIDSEWTGSGWGKIDKLAFNGDGIGWSEVAVRFLVSGNIDFTPGAGDVTSRLVWDYSGIDFSALPATPSEFYFAIPVNSDNGGPFYFDNVVFFDSALANEPSPANTQTQVDQETNLSWTAGLAATQHDIYFGTSFAEVNDADNSGAPGPTEVYRARQSVGNEAYTIPETLQIGKTYYWRVDENDGIEWLKGDVWSFTTKVAEARAPYPADGATDVPQPVVLSWFAGVDANSHDVYFGTAFDDVNDANTSSTEYEGNQPLADTNYAPGSLIWNKTYFWRIDEVNDPNTWKGPVWSFTVAPAIASSPSPSSSSSDVSPFVVLSWTPGAEADSHEVYFSTYFNDVNNRNPSVLTVRGPNNYDPCGVLEFSTLYYWAVDEFNLAADPNRWLGEVWSFTTADHFTVDDFDLYADHTALKAIWTVGHLTNNGAELFLETDPNFVHDGNSMRFAYRNYNKSQNKYVGSEAEADASALGAGTDWTANGVKAMMLYFYGDAGNGTDQTSPITTNQMYVALVDGDTNVGVVKYDTEHNYDLNAVTEASWHEWNISLQDPCLIAVDMNNVAKVYIGFGGQKTGQSEAGAGMNSANFDTVWFDDIEVWPPRCRSEYGPAAGDFDDDCFVGYEDLDMMAGEWLETDVNIVLSVSPPNAPVLWYKFEETEGTIVKDEMGDFNGTVVNFGEDTTWDTSGGRDSNGCINLAAGSQTFVDVPPAALDFVAATQKITFAAWINGDRDNPQDNWNALFEVRATGGDPPEEGIEVLEVHCPTPIPPDFEFGPVVEWRVVGSAFCASETLKNMDFAGRWNHYAFTKDADANTMSIYHNGQLLVEVSDVNAALDPMFETPVGMFYVGARHLWWGWYIGKIDDFQVYNYILSPEEIAYLATDGTGGLFIPLETPTNMYDVAPNIINFKDFVKFAENWLEEKLWP